MHINRIKELRKDSGKTQQTIASYPCVAQNTYSNYENGKREMPIDLLIQLACYYSVNLEYLLGLTDISDPLPPSNRYQI